MISLPVPKWQRRLNRVITAKVQPTVPGEHPVNCPVCRGTLKVWYVDRVHGQIQLPCPAYGGKIHVKQND